MHFGLGFASKGACDAKFHILEECVMLLPTFCNRFDVSNTPMMPKKCCLGRQLTWFCKEQSDNDWQTMI